VPGIFISYRRADTEGQAGRLFETLRRRFGDDRVFMDVTMPPGTDFRAEIDRAVGACAVLLAVIGREWLRAPSADGGRRLDDPEDLVRLEVAAALRRNIPVIPVLVEGIQMPAPEELPPDLRPLAARNAAEIRHTHWDSDEAALVRHLTRYVHPSKHRVSPRAAVLAAGLTLAGWAGWKYLPALLPSDKLTVLVADFDGPDPKNYGVTDKVIQRLRGATKEDHKVRVVSLGRALTEAEGSTVAGAEGRKRRATIVIWGWYRPTSRKVNLSAKFVLLNAPRYMPALGPPTRRSAERPDLAELDWIKDTGELETFTLQTTLSDELAYLTLFTIGMVRYAADDWDAAIDRFEAALKVPFEPDAGRQGRDVIHAKLGVSYSARGDFDQAIAQYARAIELNPGNASFLIGLGAVRLQKRDPDGAIADFDRAIELKPNEALAYNDRAVAYREKGELRRAIEDYDRAIALDPHDPYFYLHRAQAYRAIGDHDCAIADYDVALERKPDEAVYYSEGAIDHARVHYERAASYYAKGDYQKAIDDLSAAIKRKPDFFLAYHDRGLAYKDKGEPRRAIADFTEAIRRQPSDFSSYNNRGLAYSNLGQLDEAIADYGRALERKADEPVVYNNRGNTYERKGDLARALADYAQAIRLDPGYALAYHNRALAYLNRGDPDRAIADCDEAIRLAPEDPLPYNDRGRAYFLKGQYDRAIADYDAAIMRKPDYALAVDNRRQAEQARAKQAGVGAPQ